MLHLAVTLGAVLATFASDAWQGMGPTRSALLLGGSRRLSGDRSRSGGARRRSLLHHALCLPHLCLVFLLRRASFHHHLVVKRLLPILHSRGRVVHTVFNVGCVGETTVKQLAEQIIKQTNSTSTITYTRYEDAYPAGFEDMQRRVPDITKIKKSIKWAPANTLATIIDDVAQSMRG